MPKPSTKTKISKNPPRRTLTPKEREDARDAAYIKAHRHEPFYSFNDFAKELGLDHLVIPSRKKR